MSNSSIPAAAPASMSSVPVVVPPPAPNSAAASSSSAAAGATTTTSTAKTSKSTTVLTSKTTITSNTKQAKTTIVTTITSGGTTATSNVNTITSGASSSAAAISNKGSNNSGGLSTGAITAIAVIIPVAVIAFLIGLAIFWWRKRKAKEDADEQRRKEVLDYNYNPNNDPTLPAVGSEVGGVAGAAAMSEASGYRGWGAAAGSGRKMSTTLSGGHTQQLSDSGGSYGYENPGSPGGGYSDGHSSDPMMNQRDTFGSDGGDAKYAALGATGLAGGAAAGGLAAGKGLQRGPSNASSRYSAGGGSDTSEPPVPELPAQNQRYELPAGNAYSSGYGQHGPYGDGTYGGAAGAGMPVVQNLNARRDTRINPGGAYQQGNSGIAQNF